MEEVRERVEDRKVREREEDAARRARQKEMDDMAAFERAAVAGAVRRRPRMSGRRQRRRKRRRSGGGFKTNRQGRDSDRATVTASTRQPAAGKSKTARGVCPGTRFEPGIGPSTSVVVIEPGASAISRRRLEPKAPRSPPPTDARATTAANDAR